MLPPTQAGTVAADTIARAGGRRVVAVVPTYHPDPEVVGNLRALLAQVDELVVVDDGSGASADEVLASAGEMGAQVVHLDRNSGIARALNVGIRHALDAGADFVLTTDQDTRLPEDYVAACLETFDRANRVTRLGIVVADAVNGQPSLPTWTSPEGLGLVPEAIQSGFVLSRECLERTGPFDERLVIDCVDTEYCIRARDRGFRIAVARGTDIAHELGEMVPFRPFGLRWRNRSGAFEYQYHSPFRQYYITRNNIDLVYRSLRKHPRWAAAVVKRQLGPTFDAIVSGPRRVRHLVAVVVGGVHGLIRVRGPIPTSLYRYLTRR